MEKYKFYKPLSVQPVCKPGEGLIFPFGESQYGIFIYTETAYLNKLTSFFFF